MLGRLKDISIEEILIETYDNPGWGIELYYLEYLEKKEIKYNRNSEEDWIIAHQENKRIFFAGDQWKLKEILLIMIEYFNWSNCQIMQKLLEIEPSLSAWYANECDEYWEHLYGINGKIFSNGKLELVIDLDETYWEELSFEKVVLNNRTYCEKRDKKFVIDGHVEELVDGIKVFLDWVGPELVMYTD